MKLISLKNVSKESKILLLKELGLDSDGVFVLDEAKQKLRDRYIDQEVRMDNMLIFPGSTIVLDDNEVSVAMYMEEFGQVL